MKTVQNYLETYGTTVKRFTFEMAWYETALHYLFLATTLLIFFYLLRYIELKHKKERTIHEKKKVILYFRLAYVLSTSLLFLLFLIPISPMSQDTSVSKRLNYLHKNKESFKDFEVLPNKNLRFLSTTYSKNDLTFESVDVENRYYKITLPSKEELIISKRDYEASKENEVISILYAWNEPITDSARYDLYGMYKGIEK